MQRALAYDLSPPARVPLRYLLAAPCFAALAGLVLLCSGPAALESRWTPALLAITHLLTLGCLSMAMIGSMLQLIPAVAGRALPLPDAVSTLAWCALALGAAGLAAAFMLGTGWLFVAAAALLACAFVPPGVAAMRALLGAIPPGALPMAGGMRLALPALLATVVLGIALALYFGLGVALPVLTLVDLHVGWGLAGWVALLVVCVGFQVIPMFLQTPIYPAWVTRRAAPLLIGGLLAWSALRLAAPGLARWAGAVAALTLAAFALGSLRMLAQRRRQPRDATNLYWLLALVSLAASCGLYLVDAAPLALGVLFIGGFALGALNGMLYKIVPFLLWYGLSLEPGAVKGAIPSVRAMIPEAPARRQFCVHLLALVLLLAALRWPQLARAAGAAFAVSSVLLAVHLIRAALLCRRVRLGLQPS